MSTLLAERKQGLIPMIDDIKALMEELGMTQADVAVEVLRETEHAISQGTISRILKNEAKPSIIAMVRYVLLNAQKKQEDPRDRHPKYLGNFEYEPDTENHIKAHFVEAKDSEDALRIAREAGVSLDGSRPSEQDTSGQVIREKASAQEITGMRCYAVVCRSYLDV